MNIRNGIGLLMVTAILVSGCAESQNNGNSVTGEDTRIAASLPTSEAVELGFQPLELEALPPAKLESDWEYKLSFPFSNLNEEPLALDVYVAATEHDILPDELVGVLKMEDRQYVIRNLSSSLLEHKEPGCEVICPSLQRSFPGQSQYELLGTLELAANGPGLRLFIVRDTANDSLHTFNGWGTFRFIDLEGDGQEEMLIEFPGLHLSFPDVTIIRAEQGVLERSLLVKHAADSGSRSLARLITDGEVPVIQISDIDEQLVAKNYIYESGRLVQSGSGVGNETTPERDQYIDFN